MTDPRCEVSQALKILSSLTLTSYDSNYLKAIIETETNFTTVTEIGSELSNEKSILELLKNG